MMTNFPAASEMLCNTLTANGTLVTVAAGRKYSGSLTMSAAVAVAGSSNPVVTINGAGASPAAGTVVGRINATALATGPVTSNAYFEIICEAPAGNSITIDFTAGANGTSSATLNGYLFG